ncbi:MAG: efflux RND transporter periplasmic adaptor subunit, partial [Pseudomonadota bacterium]
EAIRKDAPVYIEGIGSVAALNSVEIRSRVTGELIKRHFKEGDRVTQGQSLFTIDPAPFEAKVKEVQARLRQARVQYEQAHKEFERFKGLHSGKAISQEQFEIREVEMYSKMHQTELCEAELETARLNLNYCFIKSPLDGTSGEVFVDEHNIINENKDRLVTIRQVQPIKVKFSVPGKYLDQIRANHAKAPLGVQAHIAGWDKPEEGTLSLIDNAINIKTGMIGLESVFPNAHLNLWPGQFARVRLKVSVTEAAIHVPARAVMDGPEGRYAWVVGAERTVAMRPVKTDGGSSEMLVVSEGLNAGETVVTDGQLMLRPGAKIVTKAELMRMMGGPPAPAGQPGGAGKGKEGGRP